MSQSKYWCFTINNYDEESLSRLVSGAAATSTYIVCGREIGDSGTPHIQGYIELKSRGRLTTVKSRLPELQRAHLEIRRGTAEEADEYCKKDGDWVAQGELSSPSLGGKRKEFELLKDAIKAGDSLHDLYENHTGVMVRYNHGATKLFNMLRPRKKLKGFPLESFAFHPIMLDPGWSHVIVGPSGCGKTSYCRSLFPTALFVSHMDDLASFDPDQNEAIIFDDMCFTHIPRVAQIHIVDQDDDRSIHIRYQTALIPANTQKVFTTNVREIFLEDPAIVRRVKYHCISSLLSNDLS